MENNGRFRLIIEGATGVEAALAEQFRDLGVDCLDGEKRISKYMISEIPIEVRTEIWKKYLADDIKNIVVVLAVLSNGTPQKHNVVPFRNEIDNELYFETFKSFSHPRLFHQTIDCYQNILNGRELLLSVCRKLNEAGILQTMVIATRNSGKTKEIRQFFPEHPMLDLNDCDMSFDVEETADTFLGNAVKKATEYYKHSGLGLPVIADDSGLAIDALDGFPGVSTHRFLGGNTTDTERNAELVRRASGETARFICELVYWDGRHMSFGCGELVGKIASAPRGENGFGFDPIFELPDGRTLAELSSEEKNKISPRRLAAVYLAIDLAKKLRN